MEDKYFDKIDRYLREEMAEAEKKAFEQELETNSTLREEFSFQSALAEGINEQRREELKQYLREHTKIKFMGNIWGRRWAIASAAIIAFFAVLYFVLQNFDIAPRIQPVADDQLPKKQQPSEKPADEAGTEVKSDLQDETTPIDKALPKEEKLPDLALNKDDFETKKKSPEIPLEALEKQEVAGSRQPDKQEDYKTKSEIKIGEGYLLISYLTPADANLKEVQKRESTEQMMDEIYVEYWVSPVGFKGYRLDNAKLMLYSLNQNSGVRLFKIGKEFYLREGFNTYHLYSDGRFREFERVVNPEILQLIPD